MLEVVEFDDLVEGDIILITGWEDYEVNIVTVKRLIQPDMLIVPEEMGGLDYAPDNIRKIVRIGNVSLHTKLILLANNVYHSKEKNGGEACVYFGREVDHG